MLQTTDRSEALTHAAERASDELIAFADSMFDTLETQIDPALLNLRAAAPDTWRAGRGRR